MNTNDILSRLRERISGAKLNTGIAKITVVNNDGTKTEYALEGKVLYETVIDKNNIRIKRTSTC